MVTPPIARATNEYNHTHLANLLGPILQEVLEFTVMTLYNAIK
jgi:hypothetical protein